MISQPNDKIIASSKERIRSGDGSDILSDILKILEDLETSLQASQDALLVHDVARLEDLTHQQLSLRCRILAYLEERSAIGREGRCGVEPCSFPVCRLRNKCAVPRYAFSALGNCSGFCWSGCNNC